MDVLRTAVSSLDFYDKNGHGTDREHAVKAADQASPARSARSRPRGTASATARTPSLPIRI